MSAVAQDGKCGQGAITGAVQTVGTAHGALGSIIAGCAVSSAFGGKCRDGVLDSLGNYVVYTAVTYVANSLQSLPSEGEVKNALDVRQDNEDYVRYGLEDGTEAQGMMKVAQSPKEFFPPTNPPQEPPTKLRPGQYLRVMPANDLYPNGYWIQYDRAGNPLDPSTGKTPGNVSRPESRARTHVPLPPRSPSLPTYPKIYSPYPPIRGGRGAD